METIPTVLFPATYLGFLALERLVGGRPQVAVRLWLVKGLIMFALAGVLNNTVPFAVAHALDGHSLLHVDRLPMPLEVLVTFLVISFLNYAVHRAMHRSSLVWRWSHQMHHSAERVDVLGFAYTHPSEVAFNAAMAAFAVGVLGASPAAASIVGYVVFALGVFQHTNIRTPRWLGYLIDRPEQHGLHHQRDLHAYNYGIPLWDMIFGTFRNPETWTGEAGFWPGASTKVVAMLFGRDVSLPPR